MGHTSRVTHHDKLKITQHPSKSQIKKMSSLGYLAYKIFPNKPRKSEMFIYRL